MGKRRGSKGHGPYWYGFYREGGRLKSVYFGKARPRGGMRGDPETRAVDRWHIPSRWSTAQAFRVLGIKRTRDAKGAYRKLIKKHHPDRGGSETKAKAINGAYRYLRD